MTRGDEQLDLGSTTIPLVDYAIQGNALLGIKESGKSYTGTYVAERLLDAGIPFICFDPTGIWRWMRVPGAGARPRGYPVVVAGGRSPDLPLTVANAQDIVRQAMRDNVSLVVDLFSVDVNKTDQRRIVRECCELLLYENPDYGLRHVFLEEAPDFVPQNVSQGIGPTYASVEALCRKGGNSQLGYTLVGQRAEEINKAVLEMCDGLLLHRQKGKNSIKSLQKWLEITDVSNAQEVVRSLATLGSGECWVWPRQSEGPIRTHIPMKRSHHPDRRERATPNAGVFKGKAVDASDFVSKLVRALSEKEAAAAAATKSASVRSKPAAAPARPSDIAAHDEGELVHARVTATAIEDARRSGYAEGHAAGVAEGFSQAMNQVAAQLAEPATLLGGLTMRMREIGDGIAAVQDLAHKAKPVTRPPAPAKAGTLAEGIRDLKQTWAATRTPAAPPSDLSSGAMRMLRALAARHPSGLTVGEWAAAALMTRTGGGWARNLRQLRAAALVGEHDSGVWTATEAGLAAVGAEPGEPVPSRGPELLTYWKKRLPSGSGRLLDKLAAAGERGMLRANLAEALNMSAAGGGFARIVRAAKRPGLVLEKGARLTLSPMLGG